MSFYNNIETQPKSTYETHLPKGVRGMVADKGTIKNKKVLPPLNYFTGINRLKPQSSFNSSNLFADQSSLDYWLGYGGYSEHFRLELNLEVKSTALNPLSIVGPYLISRIEINDSNENIMQTYYADNLFLQRIRWGKDKSAFENSAEGVSSTYGAIGPIAASTKFTLELMIPSAISEAQLKGNIIDGKILIRIYFSNLGVTSGAYTDLICNQADIIQHAEQLAPALESKEIAIKKKCTEHFRVTNPVRIASFAISNAVAGQSYDVLLSSATQMSAYIIFIVRPTPITSANILNYVQGITFELYDESMQLQSITQYPTSNRYVVSQKFGGEIFSSAIGGGIYCLPFATNIEGVHHGNMLGFYSMSSRETLRLYMPSGMPTQSVQVDCYSYDYAELIVRNSRLEFRK